MVIVVWNWVWIVVKLDIVMKMSYWFMDLDHGFWMFEIQELDNWLLNGSQWILGLMWIMINGFW